jgi:hypothetical protein
MIKKIQNILFKIKKLVCKKKESKSKTQIEKENFINEKAKITKSRESWPGGSTIHTQY